MNKKGRKGAIQLSLGFIVMIVFAVVMLSLAIMWLRGTMEQIEDLTAAQISAAKAEVDEVLDQQQTVFGLSKSTIEPATRGKAYPIGVGFKNHLDSEFLNEDGTAYFAVDVTVTGGPGEASNLEGYRTWIECNPTTIWVEKGDIIGKIVCSFKPQANADTGTYFYTFEGCTAKAPINDGCAGKKKFGGAPLTLQAVVN